MRPLSGDESLVSRPRAGSLLGDEPTPTPPRQSRPPTSYFFAEGKDIERGVIPTACRAEGKRIYRQKPEDDAHQRSTSTSAAGPAALPALHQSGIHTPDIPPSPPRVAISRPYTPLSADSRTPGSLLSSPGSGQIQASEARILSSSQPVAAGDDDELASCLLDSGSTPQLIMPSIKMPSRRPFTDKGRRMGHFRVLLAGESGEQPQDVMEYSKS